MPKIWLSSSEDKSCDSIQQALDSAAAGDTLYLSHGNYALNDPLQIRQKIRICPAPDATEQVTMNFFFCTYLDVRKKIIVSFITFI